MLSRRQTQSVTDKLQVPGVDVAAVRMSSWMEGGGVATPLVISDAALVGSRCVISFVGAQLCPRRDA